MKKFGKFLLIALCTTSVCYAEASPVGTWQTIDDATGKPKAIVKIEEKDNVLAGKIVKIFPQPGESADKLCAECQGDKHNQPIVGMSIISGLKADKENKQWGKGEILDPANGKTYNCNARLTENGTKLNVRGYIGMPLLGRSQTWVRVDEKTVA